VDRPTVTIRDLRDGELTAAIALLARGMRDNPGHVAVFGPDPARRERSLRRMFTALFTATRQERIGAFDGDTMVGFMAITSPGACRHTTWQTARMVAMTASLGPRTLARIGTWQRIWRRHDPRAAHSHFGPLAVDAHLHGRGIGGQLLRDYTRRLDEARLLGYLETDKPENVGLYERHGFVVTGEATVLGNPNWFMHRPA
jgi:GNAT superfamily N-acetyltransferase